jgi:glutathione S-transferase
VTSVAIYMGSADPFGGEVSLPAHFFEDRKKMWMTQFDTDTLGPKLPGYRSRLRAHTEFLLMQLADGRKFLTGDKPGLADIHAMWDPWFLRRFAPEEAKALYDPNSQLAAWEDHLAAIGHGTRTEMDPQRALDIARAASPAAHNGVDPSDPLDLPAGTPICISPSDYAEVNGTGILVATNIQSVSIHRRDPEVGDVILHFPKIGYNIEVL